MSTNVGCSIKENGLERLKRDIIPMLSADIADILKKADLNKLDQLEEIRLRADKPLILQNYRSELFINLDATIGQLSSKSFIVSQKAISKTLELLSGNSIYAFQEEIRNGYITIRGGHRIGLTGRVVYEKDSIKNIKDISGLNIRLSNQVPGCSSKIIKQLVYSKSGVFNTLLVSPPQCGKTTLLRDIARNISYGMPEYGFEGKKVGIIDERSEIAACFKGVAQNDVGPRTDVLDGCLKTIGMQMFIRSMSPEVIITDEIGCEGDREAILGVLNAGVKIITSAHGYNVSELKSRREVLKLMEDQVFDRYIVLNNSRGPGTIVEIIDGRTMKTIGGEGFHVA